jgi:hypothetical protein
LRANAWPFVEDGQASPGDGLGFSRWQEACCKLMHASKSGEHFGKIVLRVAEG